MANVLPPFPSLFVHKDNTSVGPRWKKSRGIQSTEIDDRKTNRSIDINR